MTKHDAFIYIGATISVLAIILTGLNGWWATPIIAITAFRAGYDTGATQR
ncbi:MULTISPECIES: hypothetical protein [unclassified Corynebacterium]|nr:MULTISPECIES: hypothetical protein [unclassified Corynebacterium]WPF66261.1 hypothetical protein OLX12_00580 [Corynebacterium sp. 22KM0430]WPF68751.1 hypothetical protein OLW90_00580 [Corynebacterium sp. 21KM1197]